MTVRTIFWGNSQSVFSSRHFEALQRVPCDLVAVVDVPPSMGRSTNPLPVGLPNFADVALQQNIPVFSPKQPNTPVFAMQLDKLEPELFIAVGYAQILKPLILEVPRLLAANFHASLLPLYRGKHPVFWTLRGGEKLAGLTVHVMDAGVDAGDIIYQVAVRTRRNDIVSSLYSRIMDRSVKLVERLVADVEQGTIPRLSQPVGEGSYFSSISEEDFKLDWSWEAERIRRYIQMTPGMCFSNIRGLRTTLSRAEVSRRQQVGTPGTLLVIGRTRCLIAAGDGSVWIGRARIADGEEESMAASCRQLGLKVGDTLG